ncbi:unnamed protein product [Vicia faba]|uniref:Uncharacterized protein n=1 Tax=Vicia faba TaxID=3906 RepID=A0AAV1B726_VICFA|nr:unnamed protein product [Vicia faba]
MAFLTRYPPEKTTFSHLVNDLLAILDALSLSKVFLIGKFFGGPPAYLFSILLPERVLGVITLGVPYVPPGPPMLHKYLPEGLYILRWKNQEEHRLILDGLMKKLLCEKFTSFSREVPYKTVGDDLSLPDPVVKVPTLVIIGGKDNVFKFPGMEDLIKKGTHFVQEQFPPQVNQLILAFLAKHI